MEFVYGDKVFWWPWMYGQTVYCYRFRIDPVPFTNGFGGRACKYPKGFKQKLTEDFQWLPDAEDSDPIIFKNANSEELWDSDPWGEAELKFLYRERKCWKRKRIKKQWMKHMK